MGAIKGALGIGSPSKITFEYGKFTNLGLIRGLLADASRLQSTAEKVGQQTLAGMAEGLAGMGTLVVSELRMPSIPAFDVRGGDGYDHPPAGGPLVAIGTFNAGTQTPEDVAAELDRKMRAKGRG
jgi:hypothetical protein